MKTTAELQKENQKLIEALEAITGLVDFWIEDGYVEPEVMKDKSYKKAKKVLSSSGNKKRPVKIKLINGNSIYGSTFMVMYQDRIKGGHYSAAQFNTVDFDLDHVKKWIENNNLELKSVEI